MDGYYRLEILNELVENMSMELASEHASIECTNRVDDEEYLKEKIRMWVGRLSVEDKEVKLEDFGDLGYLGLYSVEPWRGLSEYLFVLYKKWVKTCVNEND
jgi:hypothetical protein